ncbi:hypothetical protein G6F46_008590 [Rhizopus delemar]|nr:hypothetical protein G6F55_009920 [Rhizopus delemar]KAG1539880.1 hypothetical protein G6F51_008865 [Rhizopus arrhizus]KAG1494046.1 hypothetical protein G6F54_008153 [Rhizopus delemar]KAG1508202.1 hypothetical protein G6F53_008376 [Rhizopus delemar]KAG1523556.1 hypothetical protein G6F52_004924 [Rhizopus delemar]
MSDTPYRYNHSLSPNKEKYLGELRDTSVNIASAISSASRYGSPHYFTRSKSNSSVSHSPKVVDCLDIRNINHEAIKNDMELKSISKKPYAFNSHPEDDTSIDEGYEDFDAYDELELMVNHPELEEAMRRMIQQREQLQQMEEQLLAQHKQQRKNQSNNETQQEAQEQPEGSLIRYYASKWLEFIIFIFFMIYWIIKEPIIRTVTFFTMIVSSLLVTPAIFVWSKLFDQWTPNNELRKRITSLSTGLLFAYLAYLAYPRVQPYIPTYHWTHATVNPPTADLTNIIRHISRWEERVNQLSDKQVRHEALYNDLSSKVNSELQSIRNQIKQSTSNLIQRISSQQNNIEGINSQLEQSTSNLLQRMSNQQGDIEAIANQLEQSTTNFLQKFTHQQGDIENLSNQHSNIANQYNDVANQYDSLTNQHSNLANEHSSIINQQEALVQKLNEIEKMLSSVEWGHSQGSWPDLTQQEIQKYITDKVNQFIPHETADFALESRGARVIHTMTSKTFQPMKPWLQHIRRITGVSSRLRTIPEMALQPQTYPGECWSMEGTSGSLAILLSQPVHLESITIEYPTPEIMSFNMSTAPKNIQILGIKDFKHHPESTVSLGLVQYDIYKNQAIQNFLLDSNNDVFEAVIIKILSNWGNLLHTDLYRVRLHGAPPV